MKIVNINCRFCGTKLGEQTLPGVSPLEEVNLEDYGFLDSRCEAHEIEHGNFKEMSMIVNDNITENKEEQKAILEKSEYKMDKFVDVLIFDHPDAIFGSKIISDNVMEKRDQKAEALGIDDLDDKEKVDLIERYKESNKKDTEIDPAKAEMIKQEIISEREEQ